MKRKVKLITFILLITLLVGGLSGCSSYLRSYTVSIDLYDNYNGHYEGGYVYLEGYGTIYTSSSGWATFYGVYPGTYTVTVYPDNRSSSYTDTLYVNGDTTETYYYY